MPVRWESTSRISPHSISRAWCPWKDRPRGSQQSESFRFLRDSSRNQRSHRRVLSLPGDERTRLKEAIRRAQAYSEAGADCLYPMGLRERGPISEFVRAVDKPVNIMAREDVPTIPELQEVGVARVSLGPGPIYAAMGLLKKISTELQVNGTYDTMLDGAITFDELNRLALPRHDEDAEK